MTAPSLSEEQKARLTQVAREIVWRTSERVADEVDNALGIAEEELATVADNFVWEEIYRLSNVPSQPMAKKE